jgi:hypothetical protein
MLVVSVEGPIEFTIVRALSSLKLFNRSKIVMMSKHRTLLAITSYNQISYTRRCFETLSNFDGQIVCFDDASEEPVADLCEEFGVTFVGRDCGKGLTYSWNQAYLMFLERDFDYLIISNNDVLFPRGSLAALVQTLEQFPYVGIMTRSLEPWRFAKAQAVERHYDIPVDLANDPTSYELVQQLVQKKPLPPCEVEMVYGFCFGVNRKIASYEYSPNCMFNPELINIGQETELSKRIPEKMLCRAAFAYHYKSASFGKMTEELSRRRNELELFRRKK